MKPGGDVRPELGHAREELEGPPTSTRPPDQAARPSPPNDPKTVTALHSINIY